MLLTRFRCFFFWLWVNHFCLFWCLFTTQFSLVILSQISAACSESWYRKLEFCVTSFWFYCHRLWWSSWHPMLVLFLLYVFLISIFSWCGLFQITGTDSSCVLSIICSPLSLPRFVLPIAPGLLHCWHHLMTFCFAFPLICFSLNLIVQFTSEFSLSCTELCKVSTEDSDHVIS